MKAWMQIVGRLGRDPELTYTAEGVAIVRFSLATDRVVKSERVTDWWECVAYRRTAEVVGQYARKGQQLSVMGSPGWESWQGKDGQPRKDLRVTVQDVVLPARDAQQAQAEPAMAGAGAGHDLPF